MSDSPFIANVTSGNFEKEVIERSMQIPVLVDFWAGWCNPCKILMPMLATIIEDYNGAVFLAKVDTDVERELAEQYGIRSLPTVMIFKQGEPVNEFNGVIPEPDIRQFIDMHKFSDEDYELQKAEEAFSAKNFDSAEGILNAIFEKDSTNKRANILAARIALQKNDFEKVDKHLAHLPLSDADNPEVKEIHAMRNFAEAVIDAPDIHTLEASLKDNENIDAKYQLASYYALQGEYEKALENFLLVLQKDRNFKDDGARKNILAIFDLLGGSGPIVNIYRIKMSRMLH